MLSARRVPQVVVSPDGEAYISVREPARSPLMAVP